jgi:hypothetical protein
VLRSASERAGGDGLFVGDAASLVVAAGVHLLMPRRDGGTTLSIPVFMALQLRSSPRGTPFRANKVQGKAVAAHPAVPPSKS